MRMHRLMGLATQGTIACILALLLFLCPSETRGHTKGITLSRFGLIDISVTGNVAFVAFDDEEKVNFDKLGDRHEEGFNLTSFDIALTGELPTFPMKFALFAAVEPDTAGIEEAFFFFHKLGAFTPLLADFQATVGQFRVKFGQFNQLHDHEWFLGDPPLIHTKFLSPDGIHLIGAELTYQPPLPFFVQFSLSAQNGDFPGPSEDAPPTFAGTNNDNIKGTVLFPRVETFFDLTEAANLALGVSGAIGRNKSQDALATVGGNSDDHTYLLGFDILYRWKPGSQPGWPYVRWLTEFIWAFRDDPLIVAGANRGTLGKSDVVGGLFSEVGYRFAYHWQVTGRVDYVGIPKGGEDSDLRLSVGLRYYITPVAKVTVQYNWNAESGQDEQYNTFLVVFNIGLGTVTPGVGKFLETF
jgi:hypothetical protein